MKIRLLISIDGTIDGQAWPPKGETIDLPDHVARDMIFNKYAEEVGKTAKVETATVEPVAETATKTRKKSD